MATPSTAHPTPVSALAHSGSHQALNNSYHQQSQPQSAAPMAATSSAASRPSSAGGITLNPGLASSNSHHSLFSLSSHSRGPSTSDLHGGHGHSLSQSSPMSAQKMAMIHHLHGEDNDTVYPCSSDDYDIVQEIGIGAFATVYRALVNNTGEEVAIKIIDLEQFNTNWEEIRREIQIMSMLHHANVVKIKVSFIVNSDLWIVMPLLEAGSCAALMKQLAPTGFKDEVLLATILKETLKGLLYFHNDGRIHRDVKAGNILIGKHGEVQLADFGVAGTLMEFGDRQKSRQTFTGTPCWMAPEVMEQKGYDEKADVWSFGITAMELAYGRAPYARFQPMKVMLMTIQEDPPTCDIYKDNSYQFSKNFHSLIAKCLRKDPKKRPNSKKLMEHKFFKQARDRAYILERLVSKCPPRPPVGQARVHVCREKTLIDQAKVEKSKPVSVGSWEFDREELEELKAKALEEKSRSQREAAVENSYHQHTVHDDDSHSTSEEEHEPGNSSSNIAPNMNHLSHRRNSGTGNQLYVQPMQPHELVDAGVPGQHRSNEIENSELIVKPHSDQPFDRPLPSYSPLAPTHGHQEGRFTVSDEDDMNADVEHHLHLGGNHEQIIEESLDQSTPMFHANATPHVGSNGGEDDGQQVGRFSIRDEDD